MVIHRFNKNSKYWSSYLFSIMQHIAQQILYIQICTDIFP